MSCYGMSTKKYVISFILFYYSKLEMITPLAKDYPPIIRIGGNYKDYPPIIRIRGNHKNYLLIIRIRSNQDNHPVIIYYNTL